MLLIPILLLLPLLLSLLLLLPLLPSKLSLSSGTGVAVSVASGRGSTALKSEDARNLEEGEAEGLGNPGGVMKSLRLNESSAVADTEREAVSDLVAGDQTPLWSSP